MGEIRIQKIDGQEFVTYKDYLRAKEENKKLQETLRQYEKEIEKLEKKVSILKYIIRR